MFSIHFWLTGCFRFLWRKLCRLFLRLCYNIGKVVTPIPLAYLLLYRLHKARDSCLFVFCSFCMDVRSWNIERRDDTYTSCPSLAFRMSLLGLSITIPSSSTTYVRSDWIEVSVKETEHRPIQYLVVHIVLSRTILRIGFRHFDITSPRCKLPIASSLSGSPHRFHFTDKVFPSLRINNGPGAFLIEVIVRKPRSNTRKILYTQLETEKEKRMHTVPSNTFSPTGCEPLDLMAA